MGFKFRVRDLMTRDVKTLRASDTLRLADDLMTMERVRHIPVLADDSDDLVGIVTQRDLFKGALQRALEVGVEAGDRVLKTFPVEDVMRRDVSTVAPDDHVREAATTLIERKVGCLVVVEQGDVVGVVSESDFVALFAKKDD